MTGRQTHEQLLSQGEIVSAPADRACRDQSFELPAPIYIAMATMFAGFVAVLGLAFRGGHMAVVVGVISLSSLPSLRSRQCSLALQRERPARGR